MNINSLNAASAHSSTVMLQRILQLSTEQSLALAEKLIKANAQLTISEQQLDSMGQAINILV